MDSLRCPKCGSENLSQPRPGEYKCLQCGTGFMLIQSQAAFVDIVLLQAGKNRNEMFRALRDVSYLAPSAADISMGMALRFMESVPCVVAQNIPLEAAQKVKASLEKAGAVVDLKPA